MDGLSCGSGVKFSDCQGTFGVHQCVGHGSDVGIECEGTAHA